MRCMQSFKSACQVCCATTLKHKQHATVSPALRKGGEAAAVNVCVLQACHHHPQQPHNTLTGNTNWARSPAPQRRCPTAGSHCSPASSYRPQPPTGSQTACTGWVAQRKNKAPATGLSPEPTGSFSHLLPPTASQTARAKVADVTAGSRTGNPVCSFCIR